MPGYGYGAEVAPAARSRRRDRDDSSASRDRQSKRKRDARAEVRDGRDTRDVRDVRDADGRDDRRDKKDKKDKKDTKEKDVKDKSRRADKDRRGEDERDRRHDGRHDGHRDAADRRVSRGQRDPLELDKGDRKRPRSSGREAKEEKKQTPAKPEPEPAGTKGKKSWKQELEEDEDQRDLSDDDDALDRKREEAKKRREALKAKWEADKKGEQDEADAGAGEEAGEADKAPAEAKPEDDNAREDDDAEVRPKTPSPEGPASMFDTSAEAAAQLKTAEKSKADNIKFTGASGEDWDDDEGYYIPKLGEVMGDRYLVLETSCGKGVFSGVVKAKDQQASGDEALVAIKVMRANDMMTKAAEKEVEILEKLNTTDKRNKGHIIRLHGTFAYRRHFCLVFECMADDLRAAMKRFTKNKGMSMNAVRSYTSQLLVGLGHMRKNGVIHADIKPDNILVNKGHQVVKFCDLGTAIEFKDVFASPYLASRFYRPAEVIVGNHFDYAVDMWALGCSLFEIFTGRTLFQSKTNNDHLKKIMELKGRIPGKVIKKGAVWQTHFTETLDFKHLVEDPGSGQPVTKVISDFSKTSSIKDLILERVGPEKRQSEAKEDKVYVTRANQFADLLEQMLALDPEKRIRPEEGLAHPFLQEGVGKAAQEEAEKKKLQAQAAMKK